ncbi:9378_t:CDS:2, partial [Gigaspora margarita]
MKCQCCAILAIPPFMTLLIAENEVRSAELVTQMRNSAEDEARSAELQKERELCEDLDFIKYQLDCSEQEITCIHTVLYTPYYNRIIVGEEIANIYAIIKSHINNLTIVAKFNFIFELASGFAYIQIDFSDQTSLELVITTANVYEIDTKALAYAQKREGKCLAKISSNTYLWACKKGQINLDAQIWRDWKKKALCYREGIILITIPYCVVDLETFIKSALHAFGMGGFFPTTIFRILCKLGDHIGSVILYHSKGSFSHSPGASKNQIVVLFDNFLAKLRLYLQNQGVDPEDNAGGPPTGRKVAIGYLRGYMTIDKLYRKLLRIGRRANYRPKELRRKFLDALPLPWLEKAKDIGEHLPLDELAKKLYEIELC